MFCTVIADTPLFRKILLLKVDVLVSQPAYLANPKTCIVGYLYRQNRRGIFKRYGFQTVQAFYKAFAAAQTDYAGCRDKADMWEERYGEKS